MLDLPETTKDVTAPALKLGFLGLGWIGMHRLEALVESGLVDVAVVADPAERQLAKARDLAPDAICCGRLDELLTEDIDGVVIATPSALHAEQSIRVLEAGLPVFCQKPLGRTADEVRAVLSAAERVDRLLGVDMSYRFVDAAQQVHRLVRGGALGQVFAAELTFHNAYGPDKNWFYDPSLSGGGCVMDLGIHMVDLALWMLGFPEVEDATSRLFVEGEPLDPSAARVEDYATTRLDLSTGAAADISCSWNLPAGQDAVIEAAFYGTDGGASFRNVDGSFYDFTAERFDGTARTTLAAPPDAWGGRAAVDWVRKLTDGGRFDPAVWEAVQVAEVLDRVYHR